MGHTPINQTVIIKTIFIVHFFFLLYMSPWCLEQSYFKILFKVIKTIHCIFAYLCRCNYFSCHNVRPLAVKYAFLLTFLCLIALSGPQEQIQNAIHPSDSLSLANMISQFALPGPGGGNLPYICGLWI
jgi:hypothetical protein